MRTYVLPLVIALAAVPLVACSSSTPAASTSSSSSATNPISKTLASGGFNFEDSDTMAGETKPFLVCEGVAAAPDNSAAICKQVGEPTFEKHTISGQTFSRDIGAPTWTDQGETPGVYGLLSALQGVTYSQNGNTYTAQVPADKAKEILASIAPKNEMPPEGPVWDITYTTGPDGYVATFSVAITASGKPAGRTDLKLSQFGPKDVPSVAPTPAASPSAAGATASSLP